MLQENHVEYYTAETLKTLFLDNSQGLRTRVSEISCIFIWYEKPNIQYTSSFESVSNWRQFGLNFIPTNLQYHQTQ